MASLNRVSLIGYVGADPDVRAVGAHGVALATFSVATSMPVGEGKKDDTQWHQVECWRNLAEHARQWIRKGKQVYVEGWIKYSKWTDVDGKTRTKAVIRAQKVILLGKRSDGNGGRSEMEPREEELGPDLE